jgi:predicted helicase
MKYLTNNNNLAMVFMRQVALQDDYTHFGVTSQIIDNRSFYSNKGIMSFAPLYLFTEMDDMNLPLFNIGERITPPNFSKVFVEKFNALLNLNILPNSEMQTARVVSPEQIFYYFFALFHSPTYRTRYAEFLKIDFPRIPLTSDKALFAALARKGKELVDLHLLKSPQLENFITTYPVSGDNRVEKVRYEDGNVWVNPAQYFGGVPEAVWNFKIGGYQVCDKWLKDRKGRVLSSEDISHYQSVVVALNETIRLMREIDETIPKWPIE